MKREGVSGEGAQRLEAVEAVFLKGMAHFIVDSQSRIALGFGGHCGQHRSSLLEKQVNRPLYILLHSRCTCELDMPHACSVTFRTFANKTACRNRLLKDALPAFEAHFLSQTLTAHDVADHARHTSHHHDGHGRQRCLSGERHATHDQNLVALYALLTLNLTRPRSASHPPESRI